MDEKDFSAFTQRISEIAEVLSTTTSPQAISFLFDILKDEFETIERFKEATIKLLKQRVYNRMPTPAEYLALLPPKKHYVNWETENKGGV